MPSSRESARKALRHSASVAAADIFQVAMLRANTGVVQAGGDGMHGGRSAVFILQVVAVEALDIAEFTFGHGGGVAAGLVEAFTGRLYAHQGYGLVVHKSVE